LLDELADDRVTAGEALCSDLSEESAGIETSFADSARQVGLERVHRAWPRLRLSLAHDEWRAAEPRWAAVAQIADRNGFPHPGRFAILYRCRYGVTPS
jgi:AraC-like DNA-binding protein